MKFFKELQDKENEFGISEIQLGLTTLEEVFLKISRQAEQDSLAAEGRLKTLTLTYGALVQILRGAKFVRIPGIESAKNSRGIMVEMYWEQDDSRTLCISSHSTEIPVPPNAELMPSTVTSERNGLGRLGLMHGIMYDPNQIRHHGI